MSDIVYGPPRFPDWYDKDGQCRRFHGTWIIVHPNHPSHFWNGTEWEMLDSTPGGINVIKTQQ